MEYKDYYKILGVAKNASDKEIKAAYRRLARKHHPDVNAGNKQAEARFKEIGEANDVLSDKEKRRRYDELGANWNSFGRQPQGRRSGGTRIDFEDLGGGGFSDFFRTFFAGGGSGFGGEDAFHPVTDAEAELDLTLSEVLRGTTREVAVDGSARRVEVKIPPGVRDGSRVRVAGEGGRGAGGRRGDLYLRVRVALDPGFERHGDDLQATIRAPLTTAVLGGEVQVATLEGPVGIKIPPGTPAGQVFRLRGHGLPRLGEKSARGDLLATLAVELPRSLTPRQKELFEELQRSGA